jgi:putative hydrolase of the HAD superfamily
MAGPARGLLFDYGGTLDGEGWHWFDRFVELYRRADAEFSREELRRAFSFAEERVAAEAAAAGFSLRHLLERHVQFQAEVLGPRVRALAPRLVEGFCRSVAEGWERARAVLERLRPEARLGVVSNFYGNLEVLLEEARLRPLFDVVVESARVGVAKPDRRIFALALERLGLPPGAVTMVGDNFERDLRPAKALGMRTAWLVRDGAAVPPEPGVADRVIGSLEELLAP